MGKPERPGDTLGKPWVLEWVLEWAIRKDAKVSGLGVTGSWGGLFQDHSPQGLL
jgi:hypothetical protein